jgi:arylsulfatase A-like enzyme
VVLILTDDQRWDSLWAMPNVQRLLVDRGVTFSNSFVVNSLCCPSRATFLTGNYSHRTGVYRQIPPHGGYDSFEDGSTIATWLHDAGYTTALIGKYLNGYQHAAAAGVIPPGWDRWMAFATPSYVDYELNVEGTVVEHGHDPSDYSTTVLGSAAEDFIRNTTGPIFLDFAPNAPHAPATPEPRFKQAFSDLGPLRPPSFNEQDVSDKPSYIRAMPSLTQGDIQALDELYRDQYRVLQSLDEQVGRLIDALADTGRLDNTLIVFTSDNGLQLGEHRWVKKEVPYEESIRVPLVIRYDPIGRAGVSDPRLVLNLDFAPTAAEVTGVDAPTMDGRSLLPLLAGSDEPWRQDFLVEHMEGSNPVPTYCALRTKAELYARYATGEEELYQLRSDPNELTNLASVLAEQGRLVRLRGRLEDLCVPAPPGYPNEGAPITGVIVALVGALAAVAGRRATLKQRGILSGRSHSIG